MGLKAAEILHGGDKRWASPGVEEVKSARAGDLKALAGPILARAPIEVIITGDTTVEAASRAVAATLGALAARQAGHAPITPQNDVAFPPGAADPVKLQTSAPSPQTLVSIAWPTHGLIGDLQGDAEVRLLAAILSERLLNDVRGQGLSYSVQVGSPSSAAFGYGYIAAIATMPAGKAQDFYDAADKAIAGLKAGDITADEFARAHEPLLLQLRKDMQSNDYWMGLLLAGWDDQARFNRARNYDHVLENVTAQDVAAAARKYLTADHMVRIEAGR
jgi:zinc protease